MVVTCKTEYITRRKMILEYKSISNDKIKAHSKMNGKKT